MGATLNLIYTELLEGTHMSSKKMRTESDRLDQIIADIRHDRERQEKTYRGQALKMFPWICARCGREFSGKRVRELTVHHKDHNHDNNPPDGAIGSCCVSTVTMMSILGIKLRNGMTKRRRLAGKGSVTATRRSRI